MFTSGIFRPSFSGRQSPRHLVAPSPRPHVSPSLLVPDRDAAARSVRGARGVEDELRAVAVVEGGRAVDRRPIFAKGGDDIAREDREAARPLVVAQSRRERRAVRRDPAPRAVAYARVPEVARALKA